MSLDVDIDHTRDGFRLTARFVSQPGAGVSSLSSPPSQTSLLPGPPLSESFAAWPFRSSLPS